MIADVERRDFTVSAEDGVTLSIVEKSTGEREQPKILLVHGSGCGWEYWDVPVRDYSIMDGMALEGFNVYAMECRGYGRSDRVDGRTVTAERMAADAAIVARSIATEDEKVGLVGHSSSGAVVLTAAAKYDRLWSRLVVLGAPYKVINPQFQAYASQMIEAAEQGGEDTVPNGHHLEIETRLCVGQHCHDAADRAHLLSLGGGSGLRSDLVRHHRRGGDRNQPDHAAHRIERLCVAGDPARRALGHHFPGRDAVYCR